MHTLACGVEKSKTSDDNHQLISHAADHFVEQIRDTCKCSGGHHDPEPKSIATLYI